MKKKVYLIGGGWTAKGFLDTIDFNEFEVHIVSNNRDFVYQPLLSSSILNDEEISFNLKNKYPHIHFHKSNVTDFNFKNNEIISEFKKNENYDYLILCHGSIINNFNIEGLDKNSYYLKNNHDALRIKEAIQKLPENSHIAIMGCGLTGSEIIGYLIDEKKKKIIINNFIDGLIIFDKIQGKKYNIHAIDGLPNPLNMFNKNLQLHTLNIWKNNKINLHFNSFIKKMDEKDIYLSNGKKIQYDLGIWCGGIKIHPLSTLVNNKLNLKNRFGIPVNQNLKVEKLDNVWAAGDCAYSGYTPNAQVAYQQGKYLGYKFNNKFNDKKPFSYFNKGQVCYIGDNNAVYQVGDYGFGGLLGYGMMKLVKLYTKFL